MRLINVTAISIAAVMLTAAATCAQVPDLKSLPSAPANFGCFGLTSTDEWDHWNLTEAVSATRSGNTVALENGRLPQDFIRSLETLSPDQDLFLYVFEPNDGLTQESFPLADLAAVVNSLKCRFVVTVIDLPTVPREPEDITPQMVLAAQRRYQSFRKGVTVFTSGPFEQRQLGHEKRSTFDQAFYTGIQQRFADANVDGSVALWEAYEYAFWSTLADSAKRTHRPQTAFYSLVEDWTAQPVLRKHEPVGFADVPDPQLALFAQASLRLPVANDAYIGMDAPGPYGFTGPTWSSWTQGPPPENVTPDRLSDWAWRDLAFLRVKVPQIAEFSDGLAAMEPLPNGPSAGSSPNGLRLWAGYPVLRGATGPPARPSLAARAARDEALKLIAGPDERKLAQKNDALLAQVGSLVLDLEARKHQWVRTMWTRQYFSPLSDVPGYWQRPQAWPPTLGAYQPQTGEGFRGPAGGYATDARLPLTERAAAAIWSPELTKELQGMLQRLEIAAQQFQKLASGR